MLISVLILSVLGVLFGLGLGWAAHRFRVESDPLVDRIDALLPQTQCGQCSFPGCRPYAEAISNEEADITSAHPVVKQAFVRWLIYSVVNPSR